MLGRWTPGPPTCWRGRQSSRIMDLAGKALLQELQLVRENVALALPVAVPFDRLAEGPNGTKVVQTLGRRPLAAALPLLAKAQPLGGLRVESVTKCCRESIGRVELIVDGVRVGETLEPAPGSSVSDEVELLLPAREMEVVAELSGRRILAERLVGSPDATMCVEVDISVFVYVTVVDPDEGLEFLFVCGHRRDVPEEAKPFVGTLTWDGGSQTLASFEPAVLGDADCLARLSSLRFAPDMPRGRQFEAVEWEDTSTPECKACQFQRCLGNPVRVGKMFNAGG